MSARNLAGIIGGCCSLLLAASACGQDEAALVQLRRLHDQLVKTRGVLTVAAGEAAQSKIEAWNLPINDLAPDDRLRLMRLQIYAALAVGDAHRAAEWLAELQRADPDTRDTLRAAWLVAGAAGDAQAAKLTLDKLAELKLAGRQAVDRRLARLEMIGRPAPDMELRTQGRRSVPTRNRGGAVLVLDFWSLARGRPSEKHVKALQALQTEYASEPRVQLVGVNWDEPGRLADAEHFASEHRFDWPQHYEQRQATTPPPHAAFKVAQTPQEVLIDMHGNVRMVGTVRSVEFQYALRAVVAEARGTYRPILPKTTEGIGALPPAEPCAGRKVEEKEKFVPKSDLLHNAEARAKLDQARVYLKTGRKKDAKRLLQEIVDEYPGTYEAREAEEWLISL